eukprot:jgi/Chlat1/685/Chrsp104S01280
MLCHQVLTIEVVVIAIAGLDQPVLQVVDDGASGVGSVVAVSKTALLGESIFATSVTAGEPCVNRAVLPSVEMVTEACVWNIDTMSSGVLEVTCKGWHTGLPNLLKRSTELKATGGSGCDALPHLGSAAWVC